MILLKFYQSRLVPAAVAFALCIDKASAATSTGMPWESPGQKIMGSLNGPVAMILATVATVGIGWAVAVSEGGGWVNKAIRGVGGVSVVLGAATAITSIYATATGLTF
jgi:type IV secretory pathway VirB2 component (pilin)